MRRGSKIIRPVNISIRVGKPIETAGMQMTDRDALIAQIASPVRWVECVQTLVANGVTDTLEVGAGRTLTGLVRQIDRDVEGTAADSPKKLESFLAKRVG